MASFGDGYSKFQIISENNSIVNRLSFTSGSAFSTPSAMYFRFQDEVVGTQIDSNGLNIREWNPVTNTLVGKKDFSLTTEESSANDAALLYFDSIKTSPNIFIITTGENLKCSQKIVDFFNSIYSTIWPSTWMCANYAAYYSGIYIPSYNKVISENFSLSDKVLRAEDIRPALDFVYDAKEDIGATGFVKPTIYDMEEYSCTPTSNTVKRWPANATGATSARLADYGLKEADVLMLSFEMFAPIDLPAINGARMEIRWFNDLGGLVGSPLTIDSSPMDKGFWIPFERTVKIPTGATFFTVYASKTPYSSGVGPELVSVRNVMLYQVSREVKKVINPVISVNGVRMAKAVETNSQPNELLKLYRYESDVESYDFREYLD